MASTKQMLSAADRQNDIRLDCLACGYTELVHRVKLVCPDCGTDGWDITHTFPAASGPPVVVGTGRRPPGGWAK